MNYAEDRLDRRARYVNNSSSSKDGLWEDYQTSLDLISRFSHGDPHDDEEERLLSEGHALLGKTLRDVGWCRHATFHYGMTFKHSSHTVGDYAQMLEFAGCPELGVVALLCYRRSGRHIAFERVSPTVTISNRRGPLWLRQNPPPNDNCGCGFPECGRRLCFVSAEEMKPVLDALEEYDEQCQHRMKDMPSSGSILVSLAKSSPLDMPNIPELLKFWHNDESDSFVSLDPVLQLLLVKLTYVTIPSLAAEAVVHLDFENPRKLANDFKSHWAYFVMIRAIVLGERIKPQRRELLADTYHVPVWDLLWQKDCRLDRNAKDMSLPARSSNRVQWSDMLNHCARGDTLCDVQWSLPSSNQYRPLFMVGDSHVLSFAWTTVFAPKEEPRMVVPLVVTGLKAWHTRQETHFFTNSLLNTYLERLPPNTGTILLSAGEIDCREGIGGPLLEGYNFDCQSHVQRTVREYVDAVSALAEQYSLQILILQVAPHAHRSDRNGKATGRAVRRRITHAWNDSLRVELPRERVFLLDYEEHIRRMEPASSVGYVLNPVFNLDGTHTNSAILPHVELAIDKSGCDTTLL